MADLDPLAYRHAVESIWRGLKCLADHSTPADKIERYKHVVPEWIATIRQWPLDPPQEVVLDLVQKTFGAFDTEDRCPDKDMRNLYDAFYPYLVSPLSLPSAPGGPLFDERARELEREEGGGGGEEG